VSGSKESYKYLELITNGWLILTADVRFEVFTVERLRVKVFVVLWLYTNVSEVYAAPNSG
jgi:hypothetical protein